MVKHWPPRRTGSQGLFFGISRPASGNAQLSSQLRTLSFAVLDWHPNAHYLVIAACIGRGDTGFICDLGTGELSELSTNMDDYDVLDVAWNQDGSQLASSHYHGMIKIWKFQEGEASLLFGLPQPGVVSPISWSPTSPLLAAACHTQQIVIWNVPDQTRIRRFRGHSGWIQDLAWSPQSRQLVSAGTWDRTCRIWELAEPSVERKIDQEVAVRTEIARIGPTGELLVFSKDRNFNPHHRYRSFLSRFDSSRWRRL